MLISSPPSEFQRPNRAQGPAYVYIRVHTREDTPRVNGLGSTGGGGGGGGGWGGGGKRDDAGARAAAACGARIGSIYQKTIPTL